jgi:hypothetical protein
MDDFFNETVPAAPGSGLIAAPDSGGFGSGNFVAGPSSGGFAAPPSGELNGGLSAPYSSGSSGSVFDDPSLRHELETGSYSGGFIPTYDAPALR